MNKITLPEQVSVYTPNEDEKMPGKAKAVRGVIEFIVRDKNGNVVDRHFEHNIVKIFAKEMLAHRIPSAQVWDVNANSGSGGWVDSGIDPNEEFAARYILFGASFNANGVPLDTNDTRYYVIDQVSGKAVPVKLGPGAEFNGGLINAIPLSEPMRPLKRVESISFQPTFQPSGTPLLQDDVRGMNNIVQLSTTLRLDEYNGFGTSESDFFTITEVALVGGKKINSIATCECDPKSLFLDGVESSSGLMPYTAVANGTDVVTLDSAYATNIKEGDQIKLVSVDGTDESIPQVSPYYLVVSKLAGGNDCQLDRVPVNTSNVPISGPVGVYRDTLRIFSHRVLETPIKKSASFEIECRWRLIFN